MKPKNDFVFGSSNFETLLYWIEERQSIYEKKEIRRLPKPWTIDGIFQQWKFCNVFRQLDRGTIGLTKILKGQKDLPLCIFNIFWYRIFCRVEHTENLGFIKHPEQLANYMKDSQRKGKSIFPSAYLVSIGAGDKLENYIDTCWEMFKDMEDITEEVREYNSMEGSLQIFTTYKGIGKFLAYEMVCDMRFVPGLLDKATDIDTWSNVGSGAKRGLQRLGRMSNLSSMIDLHRQIKHSLSFSVINSGWPFELRETEHCLCEFDKYERIRSGGRIRNKYQGV